MAELDSAERQVFDEMARHGIDAEVLACDPEFADTAAFCEKYGFAPSTSANTIIVASRKEPKSTAPVSCSQIRSWT